MLKLIILVILSLGFSLPALGSEEREATICGFLKERLVFRLWSANTPSPDPERVTRHPDIEQAEFTTGDGKTLRGYRYAARDSHLDSIHPKGYVLVALGNAMIADQMIGELRAYADAGYDVYVYDYRGYGDSDGRRRLGAIIEDYRELVADLNEQYDQTLLYGMSFGGIIMMNVLGSDLHFDAAVIDASPGKLSDRGCPERVDPINHISEEHGERLLVITGDADTVLGDDMTGNLRRAAASAGSRTHQGEQFAHPFMDGPAAHAERTGLIRSHLLGD